MLVSRPTPKTWRNNISYGETSAIQIGVPEKEADLSELGVNIEEGRHSSILGIRANQRPVRLLDLLIEDLTILPIQDRIRVPEFQGPSIEPILAGRGNPHYDVPGVAGPALDSVTGIQVHVLPAVGLTI